MSGGAEGGAVLAVVPARGGSKGIPGKNLALLAGRSLLEHALRYTASVPEIDRTVVSTDSDEIGAAARALGGDVPFVRPAELARDDTAMWPVLQHALDQVDPGGERYAFLALVDPTSPVREPATFAEALARLRDDPDADGIVSVARPRYSPIWHSVVERDGYMTHLIPEGARVSRRQDAPEVFVIDGSLYVWRTSFVRRESETWFNSRLLVQVVPNAYSIDTPQELAELDALVAAGCVALPSSGDSTEAGR
jgi:N-acylneuraminate cytidylyltransferase